MRAKIDLPSCAGVAAPCSPDPAGTTDLRSKLLLLQQLWLLGDAALWRLLRRPRRRPERRCVNCGHPPVFGNELQVRQFVRAPIWRSRLTKFPPRYSEDLREGACAPMAGKRKPPLIAQSSAPMLVLMARLQLGARIQDRIVPGLAPPQDPVLPVRVAETKQLILGAAFQGVGGNGVALPPLLRGGMKLEKHVQLAVHQLKALPVLTARIAGMIHMNQMGSAFMQAIVRFLAGHARAQAMHTGRRRGRGRLRRKDTRRWCPVRLLMFLRRQVTLRRRKKPTARGEQKNR